MTKEKIISIRDACKASIIETLNATAHPMAAHFQDCFLEKGKKKGWLRNKPKNSDSLALWAFLAINSNPIKFGQSVTGRLMMDPEAQEQFRDLESIWSNPRAMACLDYDRVQLELMGAY